MLFNFKYRIVKLIEAIPLLQIFIYNNLEKFNFLFPHDKDYNGIKLLFHKNEKRDFLDIGANIGLSTIGFREMGFKLNNIHLFEPDNFLIKEYLNKIKKKYSNIHIHKFGLSNISEKKFLYRAYYKDKFFHFNNSFDKHYILAKIKHNYPNKFKEFKLKKKPFKLKKFEDIKIKSKACFVKIDVEGHDHKVIKGMLRFIKKETPVILVEYNMSNFDEIYIMLKEYYSCYIFNIDKNNFKKLTNFEIKLLIKGKIFESTYVKNSVNIFFIKKGFKFLLNI